MELSELTFGPALIGLSLLIFLAIKWLFVPPQYANEPAYIPTTIPFVGHLLSFVQGGASYLEALEYVRAAFKEVAFLIRSV